MSALATLDAERIKLFTTRAPVWSVVGVAVVSLGVAAFVSGDSVDSLLIRADEAMYRAKNAGRDRAVAV